MVFDIIYRSNGWLVSSYQMSDFLDCIVESKLISPRSTGHWHSWHNKVQGDGRIASRIDHTLVNDFWLDTNENNVIQYLNHYVSDHTPHVCQFGKVDRGKGRPFCFLNYLADHKDCLSIVEAAWRTD